jgi:hypothetical protein
MNMAKPILHATLTKAPGKEVRHLLIDLVDGTRETKLVQLSAGVETTIAIGTQFEMDQKADELTKLWITSHGFKLQPKNTPVGERLYRTIALAIRMGYTIVYDPDFKKIDRPPFNLTGAVPLRKWPGMTPKNGGGYLYALDQMRFHAYPTLASSLIPNELAGDPKDFLTYFAKINDLLKTVGPSREFLLAGD